MTHPTNPELLTQASEVLSTECALRGISPEALRGEGRSEALLAIRHHLALRFAFDLGLPQEAIGALLGRDRSQVSRMLSKSPSKGPSKGPSE